MKILYAKFFQPVQLYKTGDGMETVLSAASTEYDIRITHLEGAEFLAITRKGGERTSYVTLNNLCFMRAEYAVDSEATPSRKGSDKTKTKQD